MGYNLLYKHTQAVVDPKPHLFLSSKKSFYIPWRVSPFYFLDYNSRALTMAASYEGDLCLRVFMCSESGGKLDVSSTGNEARESFSLEGGGRHTECNNRDWMACGFTPQMRNPFRERRLVAGRCEVDEE